MLKRLFTVAVLTVVIFSGTILAADGRIPIYEDTVISEPGSYYLTEDISGMPAIQIDTTDVTVDLNGHVVNGDILIDASMSWIVNVRVTNGKIVGNLDATNGGLNYRFDNLQVMGEIIYNGGMQIAIHDCIAYGINISGCMNGKVYNCTSQSSPFDGIVMTGCTSVQVTYNTVMDNWSGSGINASQCWGCDISNNTVSSNAYNGLMMGMSYNCKVTDNVFVGNFNSGISIFDSYSTKISGNTITNHSDMAEGYGIKMENCESIEITENNISESQLDGIYMMGSSYSTIARNAVSRNNGSGIALLASNYNAIDWNTSLGNLTDGFLFDPVTIGNIYGNNRSQANAGTNYNDMSGGGNFPVCYDGLTCAAPTNN